MLKCSSSKSSQSIDARVGVTYNSTKEKFFSLQRIPSIKLTEVFEKWAEEFKSDSELSLATSLYNWVKTEHHDVIRHLQENRQAIKAESSRHNVAHLKAKEDEELAKAISLSLKESETKQQPSNPASTTRYPATNTMPSTAAPSSTNTTSKTNVYPSVHDFGHANGGQLTNVATPVSKEETRLRALYDFEAAEDNELTFKAGEIIILLDDSDENWWRGSNHRGQGLFPAQFVQRESNAPPASSTAAAARAGPSAQTNETTAAFTAPVRLDERRLDECLQLISLADPSGEMRPDPPELAQLEAECNAMAPLVDPELEKVDKRVLMLTELNNRLLDSFQMYHDLMGSRPMYYNNWGGEMPAADYGYPPQQAMGASGGAAAYGQPGGGHAQQSAAFAPGAGMANMGMQQGQPIGYPMPDTAYQSAAPMRFQEVANQPGPPVHYPMANDRAGQESTTNGAAIYRLPGTDMYPAPPPIGQPQDGQMRSDSIERLQPGMNAPYPPPGPGLANGAMQPGYYYGYNYGPDQSRINPNDNTNAIPNATQPMLAPTHNTMG